LTVVSDGPQLLDALKRLGVAAMQTGSGELTVDGDNPEIMRRIWRASRESGVLIQRVDQARNSLETAFLDAVQATESNSIRGGGRPARSDGSRIASQSA
jgi:hypothetical protein